MPATTFTLAVTIMNINELNALASSLLVKEETIAMAMLAPGGATDWVDQSSEENLRQGLEEAWRGLNSLIAAMEAEDVENI